MPEPPDAKLTPVIGGVALQFNDRYGGDVGNPIFFAKKSAKFHAIRESPSRFPIRIIDTIMRKISFRD